MEWMILPFKRYADFSGRSRRMEFWMFALLNAIVYMVIAMIVLATTGSLATLASAGPRNPMAVYSALFGGVGLLFVVWWLVALVPSIAVTVRRLHDRDMSGWWYLGFIVAAMIPLIGMLASIAFLIVMLLPGTAGPNRFGSDPKDPASAQVFS